LWILPSDVSGEKPRTYWLCSSCAAREVSEVGGLSAEEAAAGLGEFLQSRLASFSRAAGR
jgi:hypothetical protein